MLRNDRIKFKEFFETILSLGVNITNDSSTYQISRSSK